MPFFIATMTHPDGSGWGHHVRPQVDYLKDLVDEGVLKASGPLMDGPLRAGFLLFEASDRSTVERIISEDPFSVEDLIVELTIREWDPLFGAFAAASSGRLNGLDGS